MGRHAQPRIIVKTKVCSICNQEKPSSDYLAEPRLLDGLRSNCKECKNRCSRERYAESPEQRLRNKFKSIWYNYGLTAEQYYAMIAEQDGKCGVCKDPLDLMSRETHVDHHHGTKKVRAILCAGCNIAVGAVKDDSERARALVAYLDHHHPNTATIF